jgi:hypothetical protein
MAGARGLGEKSVAILRMIADGWSYAQIVDGHPELSYFDVFHAAQEALDLNDALNQPKSDYDERLARIKSRFPNAYERWTPEEEATLVSMHRDGNTLTAIADRLGRQPSALRSRLLRLGMIPEPAEQTQ